MRPTDPRLRPYLAPATRPLIGVVASGVVGAVLVIAQAWAVTGLVVAVVRDEALTRWTVAVLALFAARALVSWSSDVLSARAAAKVGDHLRESVVRVVLQRNAACTGVGSSGELSVLATRGVAAAEPYLTRYLPAAVLAFVLPLLTLVVIATQDRWSALIVALTLPLVPVFGALVGLATRDRAQEQWAAMAALSGHFVDVVKGLPTLVAHRRARAQSARIAWVTDRYRRASQATLRLAFASSAVLELVATLSVALVAVVIGVRLAHGDVGLETALFVLLLAPEAYWPLRRVGAEFHAAAEGVATFEAVTELLESAPEETPSTSYGEGDLVVGDLSVTYPGRTQPALAELSTIVPARGVTVVTGPSGCGKSTLLAAVAGLVPTEGSVTIGGTPVGPGWRDQVAWLPQRPVLLAGSVADNLRLAAPDASDDALWAALEQVALAERVRLLPGGLDAPVSEDGGSLSAGERARLTLARVVLAARPWVLLDEPTAHLDELTERVIADTIVSLGRTSAVLVVAHRPAVVALADHVLTLTRPATAAAPAPAPETRAARRRQPALAPADDEVEPARPAALWTSVALGSLASASGVALTATAGWLIVQASTQPPVLTLLVAVVGVRLFGLARPVLRYAERLRSHDTALRMLAERRVRVYDAIVPLVPGRLGRRRGDVLTSIVDDVDSVVDRELRVRLPILGYVGVVVLTTLVTALVLPAAVPVVVATALVGGGAGFALARLGAGRRERSAVGLRAELSAAVVESAQVATELVMWGAAEAAVDRVSRIGRRLTGAGVRSARWLGAARGAVLVSSGAGVAAMAWLATPAVAEGRLSAPMAALLVLVPLALAEPATMVADAGALSARTDAAAARLRLLDRRTPAVRDTVCHPLPESSAVTVREVSVGWDAEPCVEGLSFDLAPGDRVAVTGPSGSGKSTLAALMLRFLDPSSGEVALGGEPLDHLALDDVRRRVGLVDDDPHLFATTLVENVRLARPSASDDEVEVALRRARLGPWLDALPEGLDTWLGDGHAQVSGGERARLAVARSILADQPVLVLDEPTAHLDHATAVELAAEVLGAPDGRSVLWITHEPVGLDLVDRTVELGSLVPPGRVLRRSR
ncbi:thiol reductant ABC exporter subunit CydD [Nocardioides sp. cx-173]|uniref:thiol reductant ABC exporter subunit CydD n=1 Tax=Nocardioides sp. cx-173 TaxID=2898796 RepID=UPI001E4E5756|nr:thiol reductant ABC exporter subunit CydD [Nocardioides sp. cx-173]MCD4526788.1 thiol reductant ABC exporter subunit CydD [Nocardioides sp. cx-173]UGB43894.1 thiol reductant ABC exporter subunit CydD [Nocardioides sp. cx-173]